MKEPVLLGIDVGTTFCIAAIVSAEGAELSQGRQRTPWQPVPTGAEIAQMPSSARSLRRPGPPWTNDHPGRSSASG